MLGRLDRVLGMVPQREDFGSAKRHFLPILVCLEPHQTEVAKQKGQQAQNAFTVWNSAHNLAWLLSPWHRRAFEQEVKEEDECTLRYFLLGTALFKYHFSESLMSLSNPCGGVFPRWRALLSRNYTLDLEAHPTSYLTIGTPEHNLA